MLVANSFDLWKQDSFFSAAEEVQESADILESAYRNWVRQKREGISLTDLDELRREVQTALGTAKWQLEEFERAVNQSYGNCRDQNKMARHGQFVVAIESQISRVEDTLRETVNEEGKQSFQWVNLDEDERDDLAMFLTGSSGKITKSSRDKIAKPFIGLVEENLCKKYDMDYAACSSSCSMSSNLPGKDLTIVRDDVVINIGQPNYLIELGPSEAIRSRGEMNSDTEAKEKGAKRTHVSTSSSSLKIVVPDEDNHVRTTEATPKEKGIKTSSLLRVKGINYINKLLKCSGGSNSKRHSSRRIQFNCSMRLILILMLSFFLLVPYFLHSS